MRQEKLMNDPGIPETKPVRSRLPHLESLFFAFCALTVSGCANSSRTDDWADVVTGTVGSGSGFKVRLGPVQTGLYSGTDEAGLRAGVTGRTWGRNANYDYYWLFYGKEHFDGWVDSRSPEARNKVVAAEHYFPCFVWSEAENPYGRSLLYGDEVRRRKTDGSKNYAYWTQFEIVLGIGRTVRFGFNIGELFDATVGYLGFDPYGDDVSPEEIIRRRKLRRYSEENENNFFYNLPPGALPVRPVSQKND